MGLWAGLAPGDVTFLLLGKKVPSSSSSVGGAVTVRPVGLPVPSPSPHALSIHRVLLPFTDEPNARAGVDVAAADLPAPPECLCLLPPRTPHTPQPPRPHGASCQGPELPAGAPSPAGCKRGLLGTEK